MGGVDYLPKPLAPIIHRRCYRRLSSRYTYSGVKEVAWRHIEAQSLRLELSETNDPNEHGPFPDSADGNDPKQTVEMKPPAERKSLPHEARDR
jgi:hypothetical protein